MAGYDQVDPLIQWFLAGSGTCGATATGISDDDRYGLDLQNSGSGGQSFRATSGNGTYQLRVNNSGIALVGGMNVTGTTTFYSPVVMNSTLAVTGATTLYGSLNASGAATFATGVVMQTSLTVTGGVVFRDSLVVTGTASFLGFATVGDSLTVENDVTIKSSLDVTGAATFSSNSYFLADLTVGVGASNSLEVAGGQEAIFLTYSNTTANGYFSLGVTDASSPELLFRDHTGVTVFKLSDASSTYQATVTGDLRVTDDAYIAGDLCGGKVIAGATSSSSGDELRVVGQSRFEGSVTVTGAGISVAGGSSSFDDAVSITNNGLTVAEGISVTSGGIGVTGSSLFSNAVTMQGDLTFQSGADIFLGSGSLIDYNNGGATDIGTSWDGYVTARHDGVQIRIPYVNSP